MAYLSAKRGDEIGRFGLGFKSVLAVSDSPQVFSRSISFEFNSPEAKSALAKVGPDAKRYPILRTATVADPPQRSKRTRSSPSWPTWATTIVKLPNATNLERLRQEIESFSSEFLLFVHAVREVKLRVLGPEPFETSHISRDLGDGVLKIERPDGEGDEWFVQDRMHSPSAEAAREQVGRGRLARAGQGHRRAASAAQARQRIGQFWAYFPLQDQTSASALFNAPWSVNDDRTTLLHNDYNREILRTLSEMFVDLLPRYGPQKDPAAHLDYMPARGRELSALATSSSSTHVPVFAARRGIIPDAKGCFAAADLRPLGLRCHFRAEVHHRAGVESPNTGDDVPHGAATRRRHEQRASATCTRWGEPDWRSGSSDTKRALERCRSAVSSPGCGNGPKEPIRSRQQRARTVVGASRKLDRRSRQPKVIPTTGGMRALADKGRLPAAGGRPRDRGAVFVAPTGVSCASRTIEEILQERDSVTSTRRPSSRSPREALVSDDRRRPDQALGRRDWTCRAVQPPGLMKSARAQA